MTRSVAIGIAALAPLLAALVACQVNADVSDGRFTCTDECPDGMSCVSGMCVETADASTDTGTGTDAADCTCEAATDADDCGANVVDLDGVGGAGGELYCASTAMNTNAVLGCPGQPMPGLDAAFRVNATAGQTLTATVRPLGFDASVYISRDCGGTCMAIANDVGMSGTETVSVTTEAGDHFVVVDSPTGSGCYELTVTLQ